METFAKIYLEEQKHGNTIDSAFALVELRKFLLDVTSDNVPLLNSLLTDHLPKLSYLLNDVGPSANTIIDELRTKLNGGASSSDDPLISKVFGDTITDYSDLNSALEKIRGKFLADLDSESFKGLTEALKKKIKKFKEDRGTLSLKDGQTTPLPPQPIDDDNSAHEAPDNIIQSSKGSLKNDEL